MKYKFRLSYQIDNKYIPVDLKNIDFLKENTTEIKTIDEFTTNFEYYEEMINYLKELNLIPTNVDKLYLTFDVKQDDKTYEQLYAYNKTLFFKGDKDRLKYSYIYKYFRNKFENGNFMEQIIEHYEKKYIYKNFVTLKVLSRAIKEVGIWGLDSYDKTIYFEEFDKFLDFLFKKKTKKGTEINYKNIRDFLCFIDGEEPIKVKGNDIFKSSINQNIESDEIEDYIEPDNITLQEYSEFNNKTLYNLEEFEAYRDGNDYITPITKNEIADSLNDYAKKYSLKRDNGEYE